MGEGVMTAFVSLLLFWMLLSFCLGLWAWPRTRGRRQ